MKKKTTFEKIFMMPVCVLMLLCVLAGCQTQEVPENTDPFAALTQEQMDELTAAYKEQNCYHLFWDSTSGGVPDRVRHLGTFEGKTVLLVAEAARQITVSEVKTIGDYEFAYSTEFELWVYADGAFVTLQDAVSAGTITAEQLAQIHDRAENFAEYYTTENAE